MSPLDDIDLKSGNLRMFTKEDEVDRDKARVFIEIYCETTLADIKKIWPLIEDYQKTLMIGKQVERRRLKNILILLRDLRIYDLAQEGMRYKEIKNIVKLEFPDVSKKLFETEDIALIVAKIKEKVVSF